MDNKLVLTTAVTLVYRESTMIDAGGVSVDLVKELLDLVKVSEMNIGVGGETDGVANVKTTILDMCRMQEGAQYDRSDLLARLRINTGEDERWYEGMRKGIEAVLDDKALNKSIQVLRNKLRSVINKETIGKLLREASSEWNFRHEKIPDSQGFVNEFLGKMEPLATSGTVKDTSIVEEIDFESLASVESVTTKVSEIASGIRLWLTGWQGVNDMTQGGFREGETWVFGALPHNDKTGTTLTLFRQLSQYNDAVVRKPNKKPTLVRLTLEDPLTNNLRYLYENIKYNETGEYVDTSKVDSVEMARVVHETMTATGFNIRMAYIDPSDWSFRSLFNYILNLETNGADVQVLMIDYLSMIPTTGCRQGPSGVDLMDLYRRVRNFCRSRDILLISPHQLSTQARELTRGVVSDETFLPYITCKGYWQDCKGLDREFDGGIYLHIIKKGDVTYKAFQRDKHRYPGILEESKKYFYMQYPGKMSIPDDVGKDTLILRKIGRPASNAPSGFFEL